MIYHISLFVVLIILAMAAVMAKSMLASAIMLALASVLVALIMFTFAAPWAAVFELSVCAGLITVLFISVISLVGKDEKFANENRVRFTVLPLFAALVAILGWIFVVPFFEAISKYPRMADSAKNLGEIIWNARNFDLIAQILVLSAGVFIIKSIFSKAPRRGAKEEEKI